MADGRGNCYGSFAVIYILSTLGLILLLLLVGFSDLEKVGVEGENEAAQNIPTNNQVTGNNPAE